MEVAKAFTENDPDGNGKKDTTGFMDRSDLVYGAFKTLSSYFGTPNYWTIDKKEISYLNLKLTVILKL